MPATPADGDADSGIPVLVLIAGGLAALVTSWVVLRRLDVLRPGSFGRAGHEPPKPQAGLPLAVASFAVYLLPAMVALTLYSARGGSFDADPSLRDTGLLALLNYGLGVVAAAGACWLVVRADWLRSSAVRPRLRDVVVGLVATALAWPWLWLAGQAAHAAVALTGGDTGGSLQHGTLELLASGDRASPWWWAVLAGAVLGAPIVEEVVFRGLLQPATRALLGPWSAVLVSAGLFTLLHVPRDAGSTGATWLAIPTLAALALALSIARERTGRLGVPIVMHVAFNAINVLLAVVLIGGS